MVRAVATMEEWDWQRIAEMVIARRVDLGMKTTKALAERIYLTPRLLGDVENGRRRRYSPATLHAIELGLRWQPGSLQAVGTGSEPTPIDNQPRNRPGRGWRFAEDLGDADDNELRRRWLRAEIERAAIEIEFAERHAIPVDVGAELLRGRSTRDGMSLTDQAEQLRAEYERHRTEGIRSSTPGSGKTQDALHSVAGPIIGTPIALDDLSEEEIRDLAARHGDLERGYHVIQFLRGGDDGGSDDNGS